MRKVVKVYLHQNLFIPDLGDLGAECPNDRKGFTKNIEMEYGITPEGEGLTAVGNTRSGKISVFIPSTNVKQVIFAAEAKAESKSA